MSQFTAITLEDPELSKEFEAAMKAERSKHAQGRLRRAEAALPRLLKQGRYAFIEGGLPDSEGLRRSRSAGELRKGSKRDIGKAVARDMELGRSAGVPRYPRPLDPDQAQPENFFKLGATETEYNKAFHAKRIQDWKENNMETSGAPSLKQILKIDDGIDLREGSYLLTHGGRMERRRREAERAEKEAREREEKERARLSMERRQQEKEEEERKAYEKEQAKLSTTIRRFDTWLQNYIESGAVFR